MRAETLYALLADAVLGLHVACVLFIVGALPLIVLGKWRAWRWVDAWRFRLLHLGAIAFVAVQSWFGLVCPLTTLENHLRAQAGAVGYAGSFIAHWVHTLLFYQAPEWVFSSAYTLFGLAVALTWWRFPPQRTKP